MSATSWNFWRRAQDADGASRDARPGRGRAPEPAAPPRPLRPSILPKNYLVEFIAGTFGPAASGRALTEHLESEENVRKVVTRPNPGVMAAQDLEVSSARKLREVQETRAIKFKHAIEQVADHLSSSTRRPAERPHVIREIFYLDDSALAQHIAARIAETRFIERLAQAADEISECRAAGLRGTRSVEHFVALERRFRTELAAFIPDNEVDHEGRPQPIGDDKALKIINRIFDTVAPRMILIGHSQGGLVAVRTMQLGMHRVRVRDSRRFLYSPRSGRVHRYSPVALAIGLGAPFDGVDRMPDIGGLPDWELRQGSLPAFVSMLMPGLPQMIQGSDFLETLRGAFIPFDCSAISIATPRDGLVPLERTLLPVGDFKNMHNLRVRSSGRFDVAEMVPRAMRSAFALPPVRQVRDVVNRTEGLEGIRRHCSFLFDLGANWDVDGGEIVRKIFAAEGGEGVFDEMMYEVNFDGLREQLMANLLYRLRASDPEEREHLAWMKPRLQHMIHAEELPFLNSTDKRAALALNYLEVE